MEGAKAVDASLNFSGDLVGLISRREGSQLTKELGYRGVEVGRFRKFATAALTDPGMDVFGQIHRITSRWLRSSISTCTFRRKLRGIR